MTYFLLEATLNGCTCEFFFTINLFSLINGETLIISQETSLLNRMMRKQLTDPVFDQVSVPLSDTGHRKLNQRYVSF